jgi:hypothetical protein
VEDKIFFYVESIGINRVKYIPERRSGIKIYGNELYLSSRDLVEDSVII